MSLWLSHPLFLPSLVVGITVLLWATSLLPEFIIALLFFTVAMAAKNCAAGYDLRWFCLFSFLAGIQRIRAGNRNS
ncbi:integral membrane protein [Salmonella enterica subsp. arizonae]|uniref:Integral membrane protein n=1 Tax=Salmonella enterica subsp. arizonae TaxID=59203 RepID=A0A2X4TZ15_SALER|nr:integral membrane protein [Salmonella enterica subsp. arizonae]